MSVDALKIRGMEARRGGGREDQPNFAVAVKRSGKEAAPSQARGGIFILQQGVKRIRNTPPQLPR